MGKETLLGISWCFMIIGILISVGIKEMSIAYAFTSLFWFTLFMLMIRRVRQEKNKLIRFDGYFSAVIFGIISILTFFVGNQTVFIIMVTVALIGIVYMALNYLVSYEKEIWYLNRNLNRVYAKALDGMVNKKRKG